MDTIKRLPIGILVKAFYQTRKLTPESVIRQNELTLLGNSYGFELGRQALFSLFKLKKWKRIAVPSFACPIIPQAIRLAGATPVFIDIDRNNFQISVDQLKRAENLDAVIVIHPFGYAVDIAKLKEELPRQTAIIEDCAHSLGAKFHGEKVGSKGDYALFSLYKQVANLNGAILASREKLAFPSFKVRPINYTALLIHLGVTQPFLNYLRRNINLSSDQDALDFTPQKLSEFSLKIFSSQFPSDVDISNRRKVWQLYSSGIDHQFFKVQTFSPEGSAYNFTVVLKNANSEKRNKFVARLRSKGLFVDRTWHDSESPDGSVGAEIRDAVVNFPIEQDYEEVNLKVWIKEVNSTAKEILSMSK